MSDQHVNDASWRLKAIRQELEEIDGELARIARTRPYDYAREQELLPRAEKLEAERRRIDPGEPA